ncbi:DUF4355 domain-containing protein [Niallia circulans]|uniref:DUF4355 domain-containing protein n=1 Tax=Niallia circulans TaxID=1397 RepID=UPI003523A419
MFVKIGGKLVGVPLMSPDTGGAGDVGGTQGTDTGTGQGQGQNNPNPDGDKGAIELPKSEEELKKLLQSESDKRVTDALKTAQAKWEADYKQKLESEKAEAEKLAKMTAAEKEQALLDKQKKEIEDRERAIQQKELKLETINILNEKKLPITFADLLLAEDADKTKGNVDTFEKAFREAVDAAVTERLKGNTPGSGSTNPSAVNYGQKAAEANKQNNASLEEARKSYFK